MAQGLPHRPRVMQHAPRIDHVEPAELGHISVVEYRPLLDTPARIAGEKSLLEQRRALDRLNVVIERAHIRAEAARRQAEQTAAGADVEKRPPVQAQALQSA